jgi:ABC-type antimicrobial peptide transport system ATPase subunit
MHLLEITDLVIEGQQETGWSRIVNGVSLTLDRGEVLGLIGESERRQIHHRHCSHGLCARRMPYRIGVNPL